MAAITAAGLEAVAASAVLTPKQRGALELLTGAPEGLPTPELAERGFASDTVKRLAQQGLVSLRNVAIDRDPFAQANTTSAVGARHVPGTCLAPPPEAARTLTGEQSAALDRLERLLAADAFKVALLHGVTGSGKTE